MLPRRRTVGSSSGCGWKPRYPFHRVPLRSAARRRSSEVWLRRAVGVSRKVNYIKIANNTPKVGEKIYTIGSPRGLDNTFSSGEISQIRENGKILQISAPIDHGSSGGVLLNSKGEAVGITSGGIDDSGANLNYAWNIQLIKSYIP